MANTISELRSKLAILRSCRRLLLDDFEKEEELPTDTQNVLDTLHSKISSLEKTLDELLHFQCSALLSQHKMGLVTFEELVSAFQWDELTATVSMSSDGAKNGKG